MDGKISNITANLIPIILENQALKTYYQYYTEFLSAESKLKEAVRLEEKQKQSASKKIERQIEKVYLPF